jgi:6-phosphogluconolactonase/glucosamine-6-phosphate isomerase/deaminase
MKFLREPSGAAVQTIAERIASELAIGRRVLWLVSGGSNVALEVQIMQQLRASSADKLDHLAVLPMDERYGPQGHSDSNTQQLREAGFDPGKATWIDVLLHDTSFDQTVDFYNELAARALASASSVIGQFGLGNDGHTAGILPGSPAADADNATVAGYEWDDYTRMTLTPRALLNTTVGFVPAYGESKKTALQRLQKNKATLSGLPAKLLYDIPEAYVYNDHIESED